MSISERLKSLLQGSGYTPTALSQKLDLKSERIDELSTGSSPTVQELSRISEFFSVKLNWLLEKELSGSQDQPLRLVVAAEAQTFAESNEDESFLNTLEAYRIPGFSGDKHLIFKVHGHSMHPSIAEGDYVVGERLQQPELLPNRAVAVILIDGEILVKRVFRENGHWLLTSDNSDFEAQKAHSGQIKGLWKVVGKVTREFLKRSKDKYLKEREMTKLFRELQDELETYHQDFLEVQRSIGK